MAVMARVRSAMARWAAAASGTKRSKPWGAAARFKRPAGRCQVDVKEASAWYQGALGPNETPDEGQWRTEIGWPIFATGDRATGPSASS